MSRTRTIARNALALAAADIVGKLASLGFYVVMARKLGEHGFGAYTFALSLAQLMTVFAGFGIDEWIARTVARDADSAPRLMTDALLAKAVFGLTGVAAAVAVALAGGYPREVALTVALLAFGALAELFMNVFNATFQGLDDLRVPAAASVLQRLAIAGGGIAALLAGAGIVTIAAIYFAAAMAAAALVAGRLAARGVRPERTPSRARALRLVRGTFALGLTVLLNTMLFRVDAVLVSLIKGTAAVGFYGAAYRLLESPLFIAYGLTAALLPALSRASRSTTPSVGELAEAGLKLIVCALAPVGVAFAVLADPIVRLVFSPDFAPAVPALRLLGGAAALYGVGYFSAFVLLSQGRQGVLPWVTASVLAFNLAANLALIPLLSFRGAALVTSLSEAGLAAGFLFHVVRVTGPLSVRRICAAPLAGCAAIALVTVAIGPGLAALAIAPVAYVAVLVAVDWRLYPADVQRLAAIVRPRVRRAPLND